MEKFAFEQKTTNTVNDPWYQLLQAMPSAIVVLAGNGTIEFANVSAHEMLGEPLHDLAWVEIIQRSFSPREDDGHEISLLDGRRVNIVIQSLGFKAGELIQLTDITKTRQYEQARGRMARLAEMGEMTAHLAHQIRTPLASAMLYIDNLKHPELKPEKQQHFISRVKQCHHNIEQLIRDLLVFAKGGDSLLNNVTMDEFLNEVLKQSDALVKQAGINLNIDKQLEALAFQCHAESLVGAIENLVVNAINADAKNIQLNTLLIDDKQVVFSVIDDGKGMDQVTQQQVLRPFFTTRAKGTGLGLAVVAAVAKAHGGQVNIQSEVGVGSCISIGIPYIQHAKGTDDE